MLWLAGTEESVICIVANGGSKTGILLAAGSPTDAAKPPDLPATLPNGTTAKAVG